MKIDDILIDPENRQPLKIDREKGIIENIDSSKFHAHLENDIPLILPKSSKNLKKSELHERNDASFDYVDHYQKDAEAFALQRQ